MERWEASRRIKVRGGGANRLSVTIALLLGAAPGIEAQDFGYLGPAYNGALSTPTGSKPESKLWFNDGFWWGSVWNSSALRYRIQRLELPTQTWVDTGVTIDNRTSSVQDALWDGTKLYVASHEFGDTLSGKPGRLYRFSYNPSTKQYSLDSGFPANINNFRTETLVIDKDSTGTLWATWTQDNKVYVNNTLGSDSVWGTPAILPVTTTLDPDDISSLIHFNGDRIGLLWSDQVTFDFWFTMHMDGDPANAWSAPELIPFGPYLSDDHINLKTTADGRVYGAVKTFTNDIILVVKSKLSGSWSYYVIGTGDDHLTRPIVLISEPTAELHVFATGPETGGTIYQKTTSLNSILFASGTGTPVMRDADHLHMNNPTSTKQNLNAATGVVVLASNQDTKRYWFSYSVITLPEPPVASFNASPASGTSPLLVNFTDTSSGTPSSWTWDFGDGESSTLRHPSHTYSTPGTYSVTLTVSNVVDFSTLTQLDLINVEPTPPVITVNPAADANVKSSSPNTNYGDATTFRVKFTGTEVHHSYLKFVVAQGSSTITGAKLRLFCTDSSADGGTVYLVDNSWSETLITWNNAPPITGTPLGQFVGVTANNFVEMNLSSVITGPGTYTLGMVSASSDSAYYSSKEGANPPQLVVFSASDPPEPSFTADPVSGTAPLQVLFTDTSSGSPSSWLWDFGDGGTSDLQNPSHTYTTPGTYSVSLTAGNVIGSNAVTQTDLITVDPTPPVVTVNAVADANVKSSSANTNYGTATTFRVKFSSAETHYSYLRFVVAPGSGTIVGAKLRLYSTDGSPDGGTVYLVSNSWSETTITWNNKPPISGSPVGHFANVVAGTFVEMDLSSVITGPGTYSLGMLSASSDSAYYSSREGVNPPQLDVFSASAPPVPSFSADPVSGTAPLLVHFTDTSAGSPSSWLWDFGDGTTSDVKNPSHAYTAPGLYSVSLTATNAIGSDTVTQTDLIDVQPTPPVVTFNATADANVKSSSPNNNYGTATTFRVKFTEAEIHYSYIKFVVAPGSSPVIGGTLRLFCTDGSPDGGTVYLVDNSWSENTITWNNKPAITGSPVGQLVNVVAGTFVELDVSSVLTAPGTYTFAMTSASSNSAYYTSKEGGTPPQLDVSYQN